jgi:hypothetical protein
MPMQVHDSDHRGNVGVDNKEDAVGKTVNDGPAAIMRDKREALRPLFDAGERCLECADEFRPESCALALIPRGRFERIELGFGTDDEASQLAFGLKALTESLDDFVPWSGRSRVAAMRRESLI